MPTETSDSSVRIDRIKVVVAAVLAATIACALGLLALDHPLSVAGAGPATEVTFGPVIFVSTLAATTGWGLLYLLDRHTRNGKQLWTGIAIGVLVFSLVPVLLGNAEPGTKVTLGIIHLLVGGILIIGLRNTVES